MKRKVKVALGLSGGVDSAVSAYLLQKQGFDVNCVYLNCYNGDSAGRRTGCRGDNDRKDALAVAMHLGLPFQALDFRQAYQAAVIDYFKKEYLLGRTPNPDVVCNRDIKFGLFLDWSIKHHFEYVATGHYAKITSAETMDDRGIEDSGGKWKIEGGKNRSKQSIFNPLSSTTTPYLPSSTVALVRSLDEHKDQTYFLWAVPGEKFKKVLFPLGDLLKTEVREIALKIGLPVAKKKDSTGICFVGEVRVEDFLKRLGVKEKEGEVVMRATIDDSGIEDSGRRWNMEDGKTRNGKSIFNPLSSTTIFHHLPSIVSASFKVIGSHRGVWFYTIGQRHGWEIDSRFKIQDSRFSDRPPLYVIGKDIKKNRLIVGFGADCYRDSFEVTECNWLAPIYDLRFMNYESALVRIRHCGELIPCSIANVERRSTSNVQRPTYIVRLRFAQRGIAPGQSAVFYDETGIVLGGGIIQ